MTKKQLVMSSLPLSDNKRIQIWVDYNPRFVRGRSRQVGEMLDVTSAVNQLLHEGKKSESVYLDTVTAEGLDIPILLPMKNQSSPLPTSAPSAVKTCVSSVPICGKTLCALCVSALIP